MPRDNTPKPKNPNQSSFDSLPPILAQNMTAKNCLEILKESRWNNDYQTEIFKQFLEADSINNIVYSDYRCSIAKSLVIRYVLPDFIKSKGLSIDKIIAVENDGECAASYSNIETATDKKESRLIYGNYFVSNGTQKYIIHNEEGYQNDPKFKIASKKDTNPDANKFMEELLKYAEEHNFLKGKKIDPKCIFVKFEKSYTWDDVILPDSIKEDIRVNILNLINSRDIYKKNGLQVKRGLILASAPGTGKSTIFKVLCNTVDWTVLWVTPRHLESARHAAQIIELCKELSPTILLLEDLDIYGASREINHNPAMLAEIMNQLDGVQENTDIITIASTNNKDVLEKALLDRPGRFDKVIDIPLPEYNERLQMLKVFSNGLVDEKLSFLDQVAKEYSKKLTGAQIRELVNMSIIYAIDEKSYDENQKITLKESHFSKAISNIKNKDFSKITGFSPTGASSPLNRLDYNCPDFDD